MIDDLCAMNAVISLCHFCELHGPSVLFCSQAFHETNELSTINEQEDKIKSFYGNTDSFNMKLSLSPHNSCEACQSFHPKHLGYISNDHEGRISYVSTQHPLHTDVSSLVRQACIRSLSCEVSPGKEGPVFFGDEMRGHVLSHTFFLKDAQARGFHRWFSITVLMRDKLFLLNSWPFLVENIKSLIMELQMKVTKVHDQEQAECPQRAMRLSTVTCPDNHYYKHQVPNKPSRSLGELTSEKHIFPQLHLWFTWLLKAGANRLVEKITDGLPTKDLALNLHPYQETEEGFTLVSAITINSSVQELEASSSCEMEKISPAFSSVRQLHQVLGSPQFLALAFNLMIGHQIVIRGKPQELVISIIKCLKVLVPRSCYRAVPYSAHYLDVSHCNIIGLEPQVAVPQPSPNILRLDILQPVSSNHDPDINNYTYKLTWGSKLPTKCPTILIKIEKVIENYSLQESVMHYQFMALKEEWLNIAKVVRRIRQSNGHPQDVTGLLQALGAQEQDKSLLEFWGMGT